MKKILSLVLALCLLCGAVALAETQNVTVSLKLGVTSSEYVVTIPDTVELKYSDDDSPYESSDFYLTASITKLAEGKKIEVTVATPTDTNDEGKRHFSVALAGTEDTIPYTIDCGYNTENETGDDYKIIEFTEEREYEANDDTLIIFKTLENASAYTGMGSGEYIGNLTFNIAEVDA